MTNHERRREFATRIVARLRGEGFQALWAGGCVRDLILGLEPADFDVATNATPEQVMAVFGHRTIPVGVSFGVVRVRDSRNGGGGEVEVATFRSDGAYVDGRRPESVVFSSPELDAARRDFTINGMFSDPFTGEVIDYVGGRADLDAKLLRAIGDPQARFTEDKLRLLRAVRFAARFQLTIEPATYAALVAMASQINVVAAERIAQEFRRMLVHESRSRALESMLETGLVAHLLPPLVALKGVHLGTPIQPEGDLWDHVRQVLDLLPSEPSFPLAFAALLHDVGKPPTLTVHEGEVRFPHHEQVGRTIDDALCRRLKLSNQERDRVCWLVEFQHALDDATHLRESKLKRLLTMPGIDELLELQRAEALASFGSAPQAEFCRHYLSVEPAGPINPPPLVTGHDLVRHGLRPGSHFSTLLEQIRDAQLDRIINTKREALDWLDGQLALPQGEAPPGSRRQAEP